VILLILGKIIIHNTRLLLKKPFYFVELIGLTFMIGVPAAMLTNALYSSYSWHVSYIVLFLATVFMYILVLSDFLSEETNVITLYWSTNTPFSKVILSKKILAYLMSLIPVFMVYQVMYGIHHFNFEITIFLLAYVLVTFSLGDLTLVPKISKLKKYHVRCPVILLVFTFLEMYIGFIVFVLPIKLLNMVIISILSLLSNAISYFLGNAFDKLPIEVIMSMDWYRSEKS